MTTDETQWHPDGAGETSTDEVAEQWAVARKLVSALGPTPSFLAALVRLLRTEDHGGEAVPSAKRHCVSRLLAVRSVRAMLHHACRTFYPDRTGTEARISVRSLLTCFTPSDVGVLLAVLVLYRKFQRGLPADTRRDVSGHLHRRAELGGLVGRSLPGLGFSDGLILGAFLPFGSLSLREVDEEGWNYYRKFLRSREVRADPSEEIRVWGCTHVQVGSILVQSAGLGVPAASHFAEAFGPYGGGACDRAAALRTGLRWTDHLDRHGSIPEGSHSVDFYPLAGDAVLLLEAAVKLKTEGSVETFLDRNFLPPPDPDCPEDVLVADERADLPAAAFEQLAAETDS